MISLRTALINSIVSLYDKGIVVLSQNWHAQKAPGAMYEVADIVFTAIIPWHVRELQQMVQPNLPWAEEHFMERICGEPLNPPPSHVRWPFNRNNNKGHLNHTKFSHTYPERFWPKFTTIMPGKDYQIPNKGIRFDYGDLNDVIELLRKDSTTRQAYLPVWFPEDTGAVSGQRVPCSLGYLFSIRNGKIDCKYFMRSCDTLRHFQDDVYMAARLTQHIGVTLKILPGTLTMFIANLHCFQTERTLLLKLITKLKTK